LDFDFGCALVGRVDSNVRVDHILDGVHEAIVGLWQNFAFLRTELETEVPFDGLVCAQIGDHVFGVLEEVFPLESGQLGHRVQRLLAGAWKVDSERLELQLVNLLLDASDQNFSLDRFLGH